MDDRRFDALAKTLGSGGSRRRLLKGLIGIGGASALSGAVSVGTSDAARRPTPTSTPHCPGQQVLVDTICTCPDGRSACGAECCNTDGRPGTESYSECCDGACCFGHCFGEELCCPYPMDWCEQTGECCPEGTFCCGDSGCVSTDLCCSDEQCTAWPNSACDPLTSRCECTRDTCENAGCGSFSDGCGGALECGVCTEWPNSYCDPLTWQCACLPGDCGGTECGSVSDGCGGTVNCGECTDPDLNYCDPETGICVCRKSTCAVEWEGRCGNYPDGCGGTVNCTCPSGFICSNYQCVDDTNSCRAGENWCDTQEMGCAHGQCACLPGMDGQTYCAWFRSGYSTCEYCESNSDCVALLGESDAVCISVARSSTYTCETCSTQGTCAGRCY